MSFWPSIRNLCTFSDSSLTSWMWSTRVKFEPSMLSSSGKGWLRVTMSFQVVASPLTSFFSFGASFSLTTGVSAWLEAFKKRAIPIAPSESRGRSRTTLVSASIAFLYSANPLRAAICGKSFSIASNISRSSSTGPVRTSARLKGPTPLELLSISAASTAPRR